MMSTCDFDSDFYNTMPEVLPERLENGAEANVFGTFGTSGILLGSAKLGPDGYRGNWRVNGFHYDASTAPVNINWKTVRKPTESTSEPVVEAAKIIEPTPDPYNGHNIKADQEMAALMQAKGLTKGSKPLKESVVKHPWPEAWATPSWES